MSLFCWTQRKIFWRKFVTRLFLGTIDFHSRNINTRKSMVPQNGSVSHILQNIFLCVQLNKDIHTGLELLGWVNDDRIFIFGWTIPLGTFKSRKILWWNCNDNYVSIHTSHNIFCLLWAYAVITSSAALNHQALWSLSWRSFKDDNYSVFLGWPFRKWCQFRK